MCAVAIVDTHAHPSAPAFYRMFPFEPVRRDTEIRIDRVQGIVNMNLEALLAGIVQHVPAGSDLIVVSHGTEMGLAMPLFPSGSNGVRADSNIMAALDDSTQSDSATAPILMTTEARVRALRDAVAQVKALRLRCVELRACNTGNRLEAMRAIRSFFGSVTLGAPDIRDSYAMLDAGRPVADSGFWQRWLRTHTRNHVYEVPNHGRVGLATEGGGLGDHTFRLSALVDSQDSLSFWADVYLSRMHAIRYQRGVLPIHALFDTAGAFPLIFPGDDDYVPHLQHVQ